MSDVNMALKYLNETKNQIRDALLMMGVNVPEDLPFKEYSNLILGIKGTDISALNELVDTTSGEISEVESLGEPIDVIDSQLDLIRGTSELEEEVK